MSMTIMLSKAMEKRQQRIRQTPKYMEKMLFVNHKEEQGLQRRLEAISSSSRVRGRELDRERIKVRTEWRYNSRLNYMHVAPKLEQIPTLLKSECVRPADTVDPVNDYLLREYRRNSQVIPSILSAVNRADTSTDAIAHNTGTRSEEGNRVSNCQHTSGTKIRSDMNIGKCVTTSRKERLNEYSFELQSDTEKDEVPSEDQEAARVTHLVREITKIRNEMLANKKIELMRSRVTFHDLIRDVKEKEKQGSDSDTYTDGTCSLLRRKMQKMRNADDLDHGVEVTFDTGQGIFKVKSTDTGPQLKRKRHSVPQSVLQNHKLPAIPVARSSSSLSTVGRHHTFLGDSEGEMKKQLEEQERYQTGVKVAIETEKFRRIQRRIGEFLERNKRKTAIPPFASRQRLNQSLDSSQSFTHSTTRKAEFSETRE